MITDQESYNNVLINAGLTEEQVQAQVNRNDVIGPIKNVYTAKSKIHGTGLFTKRAVKENNIICPARIGEHRTIAGRYANHAHDNNSYPKIMGNAFVLIAKRDIKKDEEVTLNYAEVLTLSKQKK